MKPEYLMILGCFGLGLTIAYALWFAFRPTILRVDLQIIMKDLEASSSEDGRRTSSDYRSLRHAVDWLIGLAPYASVPVWLICIYRFNYSSQELLHALMRPAPPDHDDADGDQFHPEIEKARERVRKRILSHLFNTPSFFILIMFSTLFKNLGPLVSRLTDLRRATPDFDRLITILG